MVACLSLALSGMPSNTVTYTGPGDIFIKIQSTSTNISRKKRLDTLFYAPIPLKVYIHLPQSIILSEARFLLVLSQYHMICGCILCVASKRSLLPAITAPVLSLSSTMFKTLMVLYLLENLHWLHVHYCSFVGLYLSHKVNFATSKIIIPS